MDDVEKERQVILEELKMYYDTPDDWVDVLLSQTLWPGHPLGKDIAGTPATVEALKRSTLLDFYQRAYQPANCVVVVAGYFDEALVIDALRTRLADWSAGSSQTFLPAPQGPLSSRFICEDRPIEQGHLNLNAPGLDRFHPDRYSLALLNTLLGEGMSSRLFLKIREELGLAYDVGSSVGMLADTGMLTIYSGIDPERGPEAVQAILAELNRLTQKPVPAEELHKAREYLKGRIILSLESSSSQANWYGQQLLLHQKIETLETILARYDAVTTADIQRVAQQLFDPKQFVLAAVGPFGDGEALAKVVDRA
jgi:predicted Zn-dependent peptidase